MAAAGPDNWVYLKAGKPVRLHFFDHVQVPRTITDPWFKTPRTVQSLVFRVDMVDMQPADQMFSIVSDKLRKEIEPYLTDRRYLGYDFVVVKDAEGTVPPRLVVVEPHKS